MKLSCAVTRDLLPLYAEKMVEPETRELIEQHLTECPACRERLAGLKAEVAAPVETAQPLRSLKKQLQKRRWYTALVAALLVFVGCFTSFFHATAMRYVPWQEGLIKVARVEAAQQEDGQDSAEALVLNVNGSVSGFQQNVFVDDDGTTTVILQGIGRNAASGSQNMSNEYSLSPVPDRLLYGFEQSQVLLWGPSLDGGVEVLPRLALAFYLIGAAIAAALCGLAWALFRKRQFSGALRQVFFAPVSYVLAHLLLKGTHTVSAFLERDFLGICLLAAAIYALLSLAWQLFLLRGREA